MTHTETTTAYVRELEIEDEFRFLMENPLGRRFLRRLFDETGVFRSSYVPNQPDSRLPFFEGQRNVGLMVYHRAQATDKQLFLKTMGGD